MLASLILLAAAGLLLFAALHDVATMTIPNWVSIALAVLFLPAAALAQFSLTQAGLHIGVGAAMLVVSIILFMLGVFGGGDAKLLAAASLWAGPSGLSVFIMGVALWGGALAIVVIAARRFVPVEAAPPYVREPLIEGNGVPYAVAIAGGGVMAWAAVPVVETLVRAAGWH